MNSIRRIPEIFRRGKSVKAVVIGPKGSGKTSLITSLYSNLMLAKGKVGEDKNSAYLDLGDWTVTRFELCEEDLPRDVRPFDLKRAQSELKRGYYPNATTDWSVLKIVVGLEKTSKKEKGFWFKKEKVVTEQQIVNLEILDLPGERVADFTMVDKNTKNMATYKEWSKRVFDFYDRSSEEYDSYEKAIRNIKPDDPEKAEQEILSAYKTFLSDMSRKKRSRFFTPSTVRLDENGKLLFTAGQHDFDDWARDSERVFYDGNETFTTFVQEVKRLEESGSLDSIKECFRKYEKAILCMPTPSRLENKKLVVDVDCRKMMNLCKLGLEEGEFAPLPEFVWRAQNWRCVVQRFRKSYRSYYSRIMKPLVNWCKDVDQLYYLVDVLTILKDGREALEIQKNFGEMLLGFFSNKKSKIAVIGPCLDAMPRWSHSPLNKGCIVVTQVDRVVIAKSGGENKDMELDKYADENKKNIENLAKDLFGHLIDANSVETIVCAAIVSHTALKLEKKGVVGCGAECFGVKPFGGIPYPSRPVPRSWPKPEEEWEPNKTFKAFGRTDKRKECDPFAPPPLSNFQLNLVAKSMLGI